MNYKLIITNRAEELLDTLVQYLLYKLNNKQATARLLDKVEQIFDRLEENPFQFAVCRDGYLSHKGYREAVLPDMNYLIIYRVEETKINNSNNRVLEFSKS